MKQERYRVGDRDLLERIAVALEQIAGHIGDASVREDFPNSAAALDGDEPMTAERLEELKAASIADFDRLIDEARGAHPTCDWCGRRSRAPLIQHADKSGKHLGICFLCVSAYGRGVQDGLTGRSKGDPQ